jgi:acyl-coenzyme A thioesterase PaaI-like protein
MSSGPPDRARRFSDVTAVGVADATGRFTAHVDPEWTIGGKPNGGYLMAMLGRAAATMSPHPDVITATAVYLHAPQPGHVAVHAQLLRTGRSASQVRAEMRQDDRTCVEALLITSRLDPAALAFWDLGLPDPGRDRFEDCPRLTPQLPDGSRVAIMDQVEVRLDAGSSGFTRGEPRGRGELRGWLALPGAEDFDATSLLFAVDAFPPATFDIEFSGWVPTLELTVYVRARPRPGPVRVLQRAELIDARRVDESCHIWDRDGRLVAQERQLAGVRLG